MSYSVYVAGYISGKKLKDCTSWRKYLRDHFNDKKYPINWLDPINGHDFGTITDDGLKCDIPSRGLLHRDFMSVKRADLVIANLNTFGETRPPLGTISEIAWTFVLQKPIIVITDEPNYKFHPFISEVASIVVPNVEEIIKKKYIQYFFRGAVTAIY